VRVITAEPKGSVDTAHAINGDFLNEELFSDDCFGGFDLLGDLGLWGVLFHAYESTCVKTPERMLGVEKVGGL
jgi:hypothetical protein